MIFFVLKLVTYLNFADVNVIANRHRLKHPYSPDGAKGVCQIRLRRIGHDTALSCVNFVLHYSPTCCSCPVLSILLHGVIRAIQLLFINLRSDGHVLSSPPSH